MRDVKQRIIILFQIIIAIALLTIRIIEMVRPITSWPLVDLKLTSEELESLKGNNLVSVLGRFGSQFAYFTVISNYLFVITIVFNWVFGIKANPYWKNAIMSYITIVGIVFFVLIAPFAKWGRSTWFDFILIHEHLVVVIIALMWFIFDRSSKPSLILNWKKSTLITSIIPIIYILFTIILYILTSPNNIYVYAFLNFLNFLNLNLSLWLSLLCSIMAGIVVIFAFAGFNLLYLKIANHLSKKYNNIFL